MEHMYNQVNNVELTAAMIHPSTRLFAWLPQCLEVTNVPAANLARRPAIILAFAGWPSTSKCAMVMRACCMPDFFDMVEAGISGQSIQTVKKALGRIACDGHIHAHDINLVQLRSIVGVVAPRKSLR